MKIFGSKIFFLLFYILVQMDLYSHIIDLTELAVYVKKGFSDCNVSKEKVNSSEWIILQPYKGERSLQIPKLSIPDLPKRNFLEFRAFPKGDFTFVFFIDIPFETYKTLKAPGIYFERIGESWEIFWNNVSIDKKISYNRSFTLRGYFVEIPLSVIKQDLNVLCVHIIGDPVSTRTGFYYGKNYYIDELINIFYKQLLNYFLIIFLITLYISFGIFNIIFFIKQKENKYNLYFSIFCFLISLYIFSRSPLVQYIPILKNPDIHSLIEFISLYLLIPTFSLFFYDIFKNKIPKKFIILFRISEIHGILFALFVLFSPTANLYGGILIFWQLSAIIFIFMFTFIIIYLFFKEYQINKTLYKSILESFIKSLLFTVPGNFLIGVIFITFFVSIDIYLNFKKISAPNISNYGFLFFLSGISFRIAYNIIYLLNQLKISENKYRYLYNHSSDILILLDNDFIIKDVNQSIEKILNWKKEYFINFPLEKIIYKSEKERNPILKQLNEYLYKSLENENQVKIILPIIANQDIPFRYFDVQFTKIYIDILAKPEILMKCSLIHKNPIIHYLEKEYQKYIIDTDFIHIERILPKITESLSEFIDEMELSLIRIGLREILINAIEHGNLGITNEEKTKYLTKGIYDVILKQKLENPEIKNKKIIVEYKLTKEEVFFKVTDEGNGFDVTRITKKEIDESSLHGRGIFITKNAFNKVIYNKKGNSVILIKKISNKK